MRDCSRMALPLASLNNSTSQSGHNCACRLRVHVCSRHTAKHAQKPLAQQHASKPVAVLWMMLP